MTIAEIYKFIEYVASKNQKGRITPEQFNEVVNRAQMSLFMERIGNPQEYQPGRPVPRVAYALTQRIRNDLAPFLSNPTLVTIPADGKLELPEDCKYVVALRTESDDTIVDVDHDKIGYRLKSEIVAPTLAYPIAVHYKGYIQLYPKNIANATLEYLRYPVKALYAFTVENGRPVYDEASSVQLEWDEICVNDIISRALIYIGINLQDGQLASFAAQMKTAGS
jgi:hypothetical protein